MKRSCGIPFLTLGLLTLAACATADSGPCTWDTATSRAASGCAVPGFPDRPYDIYLPDGHDGRRPVSVILAMHGGGGNSAAGARTSCPDGDPGHPACLHAMANREGFTVVYPNGTSSRLFERIRTWNAGGGKQGWQCVSGLACDLDVDETAYFIALMDDLDRRLAVDHDRFYATGFSNGGAMAHRLACEMSQRIAAIAPVGGANQFATVSDCAPARQIPVLQIHGTRDPCWAYEGGPAACAQKDGKDKASVMRSMDAWARINGCEAGVRETSVASEPGIESTRISWQGCAAETVLIRMDGAGHVWPNGWSHLGERVVGRMARGWSANSEILAFFAASATNP